MGNLSGSLKKFLQNKNTVTVVGVVIAIFVLYFAYTMRISSAINPVVVPYATEDIPAGTQITEAMVESMEVPPSMLSEDVIRNAGEIIDKYTAADTVIPAVDTIVNSENGTTITRIPDRNKMYQAFEFYANGGFPILCKKLGVDFADKSKNDRYTILHNYYNMLVSNDLMDV